MGTCLLMNDMIGYFLSNESFLARDIVSSRRDKVVVTRNLAC